MSDTEKADLKNWYEAKRKEIEIYNADGARVPLHHVGGGRRAFLCCSGPSLKSLDLTILNRRGIVTMGLNNSPAALAEAGIPMPTYWVCVDKASHFIEQTWKDAACAKFAPLGHVGKKIKARDLKTGALIDSAFKVEECPNVLFFNRNSRFSAPDYLTQRDFNWGNAENVTDDLGNKGARSVMLVALKILYYLGFKTVYLLGADFKMEKDAQNYAFDQERTPWSVESNNRTYTALNSRFAALRPYFASAGFEVVNCTPGSGLESFEFGNFERAVALASQEVTEKPIDTRGHYEL